MFCVLRFAFVFPCPLCFCVSLFIVLLLGLCCLHSDIHSGFYAVLLSHSHKLNHQHKHTQTQKYTNAHTSRHTHIKKARQVVWEIVRGLVVGSKFGEIRLFGKVIFNGLMVHGAGWWWPVEGVDSMLTQRNQPVHEARHEVAPGCHGNDVIVPEEDSFLFISQHVVV